MNAETREFLINKYKSKIQRLENDMKNLESSTEKPGQTYDPWGIAKISDKNIQKLINLRSKLQYLESKGSNDPQLLVE